jgi:hypothetical protein
VAPDEATGDEGHVAGVRVHGVDRAAPPEAGILRPAWQQGDVQQTVRAQLHVGRHGLEVVCTADRALWHTGCSSRVRGYLERLRRQHGKDADRSVRADPEEIVAAGVRHDPGPVDQRDFVWMRVDDPGVGLASDLFRHLRGALGRQALEPVGVHLVRVVLRLERQRVGHYPDLVVRLHSPDLGEETVVVFADGRIRDSALAGGVDAVDDRPSN